MRKKRLWMGTILLGGTFSAAVLFNGTGFAEASSSASSHVSVNLKGFPIVKQPIDITVAGDQVAANGPWDQMLMWQQYQKMTNIDVTFNTVPDSDWSEKFNLMFASNQLPDAFVRGKISTSDQVKYGEDGDLIPLEKLIPKYAPNFNALMKKYPSIRQAITAPNGHIYALPGVVTVPNARLGLKPWINQTWLNQLHLKMPTTDQQLLDVLMAFKKAYPNSIPMDAVKFGSLVTALEGSWGLEQQFGDDVNIVNGKVEDWLTSPRYESLLKFLHTAYQDGLINPQIVTQTQAQWLSDINSGNVGLIFIQTENTFDTVSKNYVGMAPIAGPFGDRIESAVSPIARDLGAFAITKNDQYPAATLKWIDYFYGAQGSIFFRYGVLGKTYHMENGKPEYMPSIVYNKNGESWAIGQFTIWPGGSTPEWINAVNSSAISAPQDLKAAKTLKPYVPKTLYGPPMLTAAQNQEFQQIGPNLTQYVQQAGEAFMTGQMSFSQWPQYVANLKKLKIDELRQIYQQVYDSLNKQK